MAAESERPPCLDGASDRSRDAKEAESATDAAHRAPSEGDLTNRPVVKSKSQSMSQVPKLAPNLPTSTLASASNSAVSSRESSPSRTSRPTVSSPANRVRSQSRKSSQDRTSPTRTPSHGIPSAITDPSTPPAQRAPTNPSNPPVLSPPSSDPSANVLSPEKSNMASWVGNRRTEQESTQPNTSHKRSTLPQEEHGKVDRSTPRAVTRGVSGQGPPLETVQEMASNPSTPSSDTAAKPVTPDDSRLHTIDENPIPRAAKQNTESGSDSGGNRSSESKEEPRSHTPGPTRPSGAIMPKRSTTSLSAGARGKPSDGSVRNMIVETETVSSIPQVSMGVGSAERGNAARTDQGTLRMKPSTETIRPRKDKKKNRRPATLTKGPASSKADIFEAKVASAVDEADVSDSDETFVYESNPPDPYPARQPRYHSRTPSATSMASQADQMAGRGRGGLRDNSHSVTGKRSMKFTNNTYANSMDGETPEGDGTRNPSRAESGTVTPRHHHLSRHGRSGMHPSLFDGEPHHPQPQSLKSPRHFIANGYRNSRNSNTRSSPNYRSINGSKKIGDLGPYDYDAEGADDERTPLMNSPKIPRSRPGRRPNSASARQIEHMEQYERGYLSRYGSCVILLLMLLIIVGGVTSFIVAATKTLLDVQVVAVQNVLASEQEIMLDLNVEALNPNIFPVTIDDTDINIFAKSRYVGTDKFWRDHGSDEELDRFPRVEQSRRRWHLSQVVRCLGNMDCVRDAVSRQSQSPHTRDGVDRGTDPITDPEGDSQTMLLGRVFRFDSPLSFEASPWNWAPSTSKGQIRLPRPGNKTEEGGSERWERVLQHPFDLIVRGVVKYQLPLNSRYHSSSISSSVRVIPDNETQPPTDPDPTPTPPSNETARISLTKRTTILPPADLNAHPEHRSGVSPRQFTA